MRDRSTLRVKYTRSFDMSGYLWKRDFKNL